jgi:transcriptional regulator with XRE-family HTH domain
MSQLFSGTCRFPSFGLQLRSFAPYYGIAAWESHDDPMWTGAAGLVADKVTGPLGPRRAIASTLRQLRENRGELLSDVARGLLISTSKLSRLENAQGKLLPRDIRDLIRYYRIEGTPQAEQLEEWVAAAQRPGWWTGYDEAIYGEAAVGRQLDTHLAYEVDAAVARVYTTPFLPALLQTLDYARAIFRDMEHRSEREIQELLEIRFRRQEALRSRDDPGPLRLVAVMHETALRQIVGSRSIMRGQLDYLIKRSAASNVDVRVLPFTAKPTFSMTCMYAYFEYDGAGESDIVHIETHAGFFSVEEAEEVKKYRAAHAALMEASLGRADSMDLIRAVRDEFFSDT